MVLENRKKSRENAMIFFAQKKRKKKDKNCKGIETYFFLTPQIEHQIIKCNFRFCGFTNLDARSGKKICRVTTCPGGPISVKHILLETENSQTLQTSGTRQ